MKNKGQALVEFVIILPVLAMIIMSIIDFGNIFYKKYNLESDMDYIIELYKNDKLYEISEYAYEKNFDFSYNHEDDKILITLTKAVKVNTPGMDAIIGSPYYIKIERYIYEE